MNAKLYPFPRGARRVGGELRVVADQPEHAGRMPPHNLDIEATTIGAALLAPRSYRIAQDAGLLPEHFYSDANGRVWQGIQSIYEIPGASLDLVLLSQWLKDRGWRVDGGWSSYLALLVAAPDVLGIREQVQVLIDLAQTRAIIGESWRVIAEGYGDLEDRGAWNQGIQTRFAPLVRVQADGSTEIGAILRDVFSNFETEDTRAEDEIGGYVTGLKGIDGFLGGLMPAEIMMLTGKEKAGKSALATQIVAAAAARPRRRRAFAEGCRDCGPSEPCKAHAWQWHGSLVLQWEDPREKTVARLVAARARLDLALRRVGRWGTEEHRRFARAADAFANLPIKIEDRCPQDVPSIGARVRAVRDEWAERGILLGCVVIDSLQLLEEQGRTREEEIDRAMKKLGALKRAPDLQQIAWLVLNHTNDAGEMTHAKAPRKWCNTWLDLRVTDKDQEDHEGARPAFLDVKLSRDTEAQRTIPLWCWRSCNNLFTDGT